MRDYLLDFVPDFRLEPRRAALLVIDMQYASGSRSHGLGRLLEEAGRAEDGRQRFDRIEQVVVPGIQRLLTAFRRAGARIVYLTVGPERPDYTDLPPTCTASPGRSPTPAATASTRSSMSWRPATAAHPAMTTYRGGIPSAARK